jgi:hypothetical protein
MKAQPAAKKSKSGSSRVKRVRKGPSATQKAGSAGFHAYPVDPSSPAFTHSLMRSFNQARQKAIEGFIAAQSTAAHH